MTYTDVQNELQKLADPQKANNLARFFKTGPGEYGEGDQFLGIKVPDQRKVAKKFRDLNLSEIQKLLSSTIHEHRFTGLIILVTQYQNGDQSQKERIYKFYLKNLSRINNWDLVDVSAPKIVGAYLLERHVQRDILYKLAGSEQLWERRVAILATFVLVDAHDFQDTLQIAELLLRDEHDLIHKAVGWMLREIGKIDQQEEEKFLKKHYQRMPRTMLRYAIEKFPEPRRQAYLRGEV